MRRVVTGERPDWRERAAEAGFTFHSFDGTPYWDEAAHYAFDLAEIEAGLEEPAADLHALCLEFAGQAVRDEAILRSLAIPESAWEAVAQSWRRGDPSLYGRLDFAYGGEGAGPAKLLEYNADTPTALYESAVFQWLWLEDGLATGRLASGTDQFNAVHEALIARFRETGARACAFTCMEDAPEDRGTVAYLQDCAHQAGLDTAFVPLDALGVDGEGTFVDAVDSPLTLLFKLYPWEWAFRDDFGARVAGSPTRFLEPPWKALLSNKGLLAHLWRMAPGHPNLLPAFFEDDPAKAALGTSFARKPLYSREGANVLLVRDGQVLERRDGGYGAEGHVRQALAELPEFDGQRALVGCWMVGSAPKGLCVRESEARITTDRARFVPHVIAG